VFIDISYFFRKFDALIRSNLYALFNDVYLHCIICLMRFTIGVLLIFHFCLSGSLLTSTEDIILKFIEFFS